MKKTGKLHLIGNAHLDPVWLWRWQEGFAEVLATYRSALDRMNDFADFKFTSACSVYYEWIERVDPKMFEGIKQRVKEGRWNIVGGWYLQPDCNMPDGESFARHSLIGQRYFQKKFGMIARTGYNVDSFGHTAALPKILKASGMENYVFMRPSCEEQGRQEQLFTWESDDGSKVCAYRIPYYYNLTLRNIDLLQEIQKRAEEDGVDRMAFYGVGNHGGGPTIALIDAIQRMQIDGAVYSTPDRYFSEIDTAALPVLQGELQHHARGCYSAVSFVKRANRKCEQNLLAAEKLCMLAKTLTGEAYPAKKLKKAWKNVLFNQFHDILCGCSIKKAYEDAAYLYGETMSITEQAMNIAMQKIAWNIDTLGEETLPSYKEWKVWEHEVLGTPVVVFNPHTWDVKTAVSVDQGVVKKMTNERGEEIPFQIVRGDQTNGEDKYHVAFTADVPALGYRVYRLFVEKESEKTFENEFAVTPTSLENAKVRVEFDVFTGDICRIYDKEQERTIVDRPCRAVLLDDTDCDTWAHDRKTLGDTIGIFDSPVFTIVEQGPVCATLRIVTTYKNSTLQREYMLTAGSKEVVVKTKVDFYEKHRVLKFTFPLAADKKVVAKIPYGTIVREGYTGEEPCGSWVASGGVCMANDSKYGYDTKDNEVRMTVLRSAIYADYFGQSTRDEACAYMEQGISEFVYSIFPYTTNAAAEKQANVLNFALPHILGSFHKGKLPATMRGFICDNDDLLVAAIKQAEDSEDVAVRVYENNGNEIDARMEVLGKSIDARLSHHAIKTFVGDKETNLLEW